MPPDGHDVTDIVPSVADELRFTATEGPVIGSLCTGMAGLDLGVAAVLGGRIAWCADTDPHAGQVLAARLPGVPNLGDLRAVDFTRVEPVDVLIAGFPCQDISAAGRRAGIEKGTRSGLWGPTSWTPFAYYDPASSSWRTWPRSAGATAASTAYSQGWPKRGTTRSGVAYAPPTSAPPTAGNACSCVPSPSTPGTRMMPTPQARDGEPRGPVDPVTRRAGGHQVNLNDAVHQVVKPLPPPRTSGTRPSPQRPIPAGCVARADSARSRRTPSATPTKPTTGSEGSGVWCGATKFHGGGLRGCLSPSVWGPTAHTDHAGQEDRRCGHATALADAARD